MGAKFRKRSSVSSDRDRGKAEKEEGKRAVLLSRVNEFGSVGRIPELARGSSRRGEFAFHRAETVEPLRGID